MDHNNDNINEAEFFKKVETPFSKSKEDVWSESFQTMFEEDQAPEVKVVKLSFARYAAAASITLMLTLGLVMRFYTQTVISTAGEQFAHQLPDGSMVHLNAVSSLSYHPFWWSMDRSMEFEGEAFFEVKKGSDFSVVSELGTTKVLGTSFNISTRDKAYKVYCKTGKVSVSVQDEEIVITPNMLAELHPKLIVKEHVSETEVLAWQLNYFFFANKKIRAVFNEIERRYSITINTNYIDEDLHYSGSFEQFEQPDATIEIIGLTLGYQIIKESDSHYIVSAK